MAAERMTPRVPRLPPHRAPAGRRPGVAATREALLAAGADLFAERGYEGVPVWAIAEKAGVNKAMISYHFGGKRNLYLAIVEATFADIVSQMERLAASRSPAPEALRALIAVVGDVASRRHPHFCTMMLRELLAGGPHLDPKTVAMPLRVLAAVKRVVERGVREGAFRPVDPLLTHLSLVGSLVFFFATARFRERVLSGDRSIVLPAADAYVKHIQDLATQGLAAAETRGRALDASPPRWVRRTPSPPGRAPRRP
jgi:AcrR family transcriptional regulator